MNARPDAEQIVFHLANRIRIAERTMASLNEELSALLIDGSRADCLIHLDEIKRWATRWQTLVEVWQHATNERWTTD